VLRAVFHSDSPLRRPALALVAWLGVFGGWLLLALVLGLWPFERDPARVAGATRGAPAPVSASPSPVVRASPATAAVLPSPRLSSATHTTDQPSARREVTIAWAVDLPPGRSVAGFSFEWSTAPDAVPDRLIDLDGAVTELTSAPLPDGVWWFHLRWVDRLGTWSETAHLGPFVIQGAAAATPAAATAPRPATTAAPSPAAATAVRTPIPPAAPTRVATPAATVTPPPTPTAVPSERSRSAVTATPPAEGGGPATPTIAVPAAP
jgi:hypothetical protein